MKKIIIGVTLVFLIFFIFIITSFEEAPEKDFPPWQAKYIWIDESNITEENKANKWICFRKEFTIDSTKNTKNSIARIAADSKYWLYINGKIVIQEGGLKRSEKTNSTYYDEVNIGKYLNKGKNVISVLVWYFGKTGFSHIDSGQGTLLFQAQIGNNEIISDRSWKVLQHPAYLQNDYTKVNSLRLSEYNIFYDANNELSDWTSKKYDDSTWESAKEYGSSQSENALWGTLIKRDIPQFKFSKIKNYENSNDYKNHITKEDEIIKMRLPYNMQVIPYLKINAPSGMQIKIDPNSDYNLDGSGHKTFYITKSGEQEFESLAWVNGDVITYFIPKGIEIIQLGYKQTGYDANLTGNFSSNDEFFNKLWTMAQNTLYVNMRDNYMDCPDRERALWIADTSIEMEEAMYSLDTSANNLYEKCIKTLINWESDNIFYTVAPSTVANYHLPIQNLLSISAVNEYYKYTGNKDLLEFSYSTFKNYLNNWSLNTSSPSLLSTNEDYNNSLWKWYDAEDENVNIYQTNDTEIAETFWYYYALNSFCEIAKTLKYEEDFNSLNQKKNELANAINSRFWDGTGYKSPNFNGYDPKVNSIAIISGIANREKFDSIFNVLINNYNCSTFMEKYVLQALCITGKIQDVQNRIKIRYENMVNNDIGTSTLWEYWSLDNTNVTTNHAWSGGPLIIMSKYFAGIEPLSPGYNNIIIKPQFGNLKNINAEVDTVKGKISLKAKKETNKLEISVSVPRKTKIAIEKIKNDLVITSGLWNKIYDKGEVKKVQNIKYDSEDENYVYFYINSGSYKFIAK